MPEDRAPRVSVILPVHNGESYLAGAVKSILCQSFQDFELLILNDGSTDATGTIASDFAAQDSRVRVFSQEKSGLTATLNLACALASGEFIARQDADDLSLPNRLQEQVRYLDAKREVGMCGTWSWVVHPQAGVLGGWEFPNNSQLLYQLLVEQCNPFIHGSVMFRRELFARLPGGYRFGDVAQDLDLWLRMGEISKLGMVESTQFAYFLSPGSITEQQNELIRDETEMIRRLQSERVQVLQSAAGNAEPVTLLPTQEGMPPAAQLPLAPPLPPEAPVAQNGSGMAVGELGWYGAAIYRLLAGDASAFRRCLREVVQLRGKLRHRARILWSLSFFPWVLQAAYRRKMGGKSKYLRYYKAGQMSLNIPE